MSLLSPSYGNQSVHTGQQDVTVHRNEVHAKLVAIMRERLNANLKQLPAVADSWGAQPASPAAPPPSSFAAANAKQLRILGQVCISCSASTCVQPENGRSNAGNAPPDRRHHEREVLADSPLCCNASCRLAQHHHFTSHVVQHEGLLVCGTSTMVARLPVMPSTSALMVRRCWARCCCRRSWTPSSAASRPSSRASSLTPSSASTPG